MDVWWQLTQLVRWGRRSNVYFREIPTRSITLHGINNTHERSKHVSSLPTPIMTETSPCRILHLRLWSALSFNRFPEGERERERWWWWNGANLIVVWVPFAGSMTLYQTLRYNFSCHPPLFTYTYPLFCLSTKIVNGGNNDGEKSTKISFLFLLL